MGGVLRRDPAVECRNGCVYGGRDAVSRPGRRMPERCVYGGSNFGAGTPLGKVILFLLPLEMAVAGLSSIRYPKAPRISAPARENGYPVSATNCPALWLGRVAAARASG